MSARKRYGVPTYKNTALGKVPDGGDQRVFRIERPLCKSTDMVSKGRDRDNVDHELAEKVETVESAGTGDTFQNLHAKR